MLHPTPFPICRTHAVLLLIFLFVLTNLIALFDCY